MDKIITDCETNGFLQECDKLLCVSWRNVEANVEILFTNRQTDEFLSYLKNQIGKETVFIGHNIFSFDNEVFKKLLNIDLTKQANVIVEDTIIMSQLFYPDLKDHDFKTWPHVPGKLKGSHSLEAWGHRLGCYKGEYKGGFVDYNDEMGKYCSQDTLVTLNLYNFLKSVEAERVVYEST